jgi:serine/threonine protein phosphatase PrpC
LTKDHHPGDPVERAAVEERGGIVARKKPNSCWRVNGDLNMTRSMGDVKWKRPRAIISCVPDVTVLTLTNVYESIVLASDGLWAYFNSEMGANYARNDMTAEGGARAMVDKIKGWIEGTSHRGDNTSVTVLKLHWGQSRPEAQIADDE